MRLLSLRLIVSLIVGITLVSLLSSYYSVRMERRELRHDLERRAELLGESLAANVERSLEKGSPRDLQRIVQRFGNREHLAGIAVYNVSATWSAETPGLASILSTPPGVVAQAIADNQGKVEFTRSGRYIPSHLRNAAASRRRVIGAPGNRSRYRFHRESKRDWCGATLFCECWCRWSFIALVTLLIVRWSLSGPIARAAQWMRTLRTQRGAARNALPDLGLIPTPGQRSCHHCPKP